MNNDFAAHSCSDWSIIFTCDCVTRENSWQIASHMPPKSSLRFSLSLTLMHFSRRVPDINSICQELSTTFALCHVAVCYESISGDYLTRVFFRVSAMHCRYVAILLSSINGPTHEVSEICVVNPTSDNLYSVVLYEILVVKCPYLTVKISHTDLCLHWASHYLHQWWLFVN